MEIVKVKLLSRVRLFGTLWTVARHAPLSMGFSGQEYWSGLPFPSPEDLPDPGIEPKSPALQAAALPSEPLLGMLLEKSEEITPGRTERQSQSKNNAQLWMRLVIEARSDAVKSNNE